MSEKDAAVASVQEQLETMRVAFTKLQLHVERAAAEEEEDGGSNDGGGGSGGRGRGGDDDSDGGDDASESGSTARERSWTRNYKKKFEELKVSVGLRADLKSLPTPSRVTHQSLPPRGCELALASIIFARFSTSMPTQQRG
eukprot:6154221-Pleurochrysis_carterae.AAC.3